MTADRHNLRSFLLLAPAGLVMTLCFVIPMAFVTYYSVHDTFGGNSFIRVGATGFAQILVAPEFHGALARSFGFSLFAATGVLGLTPGIVLIV